MTTIVQIDLSVLELEIQEIQNRIAKDQEDLRLKTELLSYARKHTINTPATNGHSNVLVQQSRPIRINPDAGITEFLQEYLKHGRADTSVIIEAYADHVGADKEDVRNIVSNGLSRLKSAGKADFEPNEGGRRAGSKWFLTE